MHRALIDAMRRQPAFAALRDCLPTPGSTCTITGLAGSAPSLLVATLADVMPQRIWVVAAHTPGEAEALEADLHALYDRERVTLYPQRETLPYEATEHHVEVSGLRVEAIDVCAS
jgi:transcription-repair coupling factor (superfamily II helicase)